jgi:hypothetical protein
MSNISRPYLEDACQTQGIVYPPIASSSLSANSESTKPSNMLWIIFRYLLDNHLAHNHHLNRR